MNHRLAITFFILFACFDNHSLAASDADKQVNDTSDDADYPHHGQKNPPPPDGFKAPKKLQLTNEEKRIYHLYEESIIDEGLGNIEESRRIWKKIIAETDPKNPYHLKSKIKLKINPGGH